MKDIIKFIAILLGVVFLFSVLVVGCKSYTTVSPGYVGVQSYLGKVQDETLAPGFHWKHPLMSIIHLDTRIHVAQGDYKAASKDMQDVVVQMALNYSLKPEHASGMFQEVGTDWFPKLVQPAVSESVKAELALYAASEILEKRAAVREKVADRIKLWLDKYGVITQEVSLSNIQFSPEYQKAIEQKQLQEQLAEQRKHELKRVKTEALMKEEEARGDAKAKIAISEANAKSNLILAEAEAKANILLAKSLTTPLLQQKYYDKWDGKLPQMMLGDEATPLIKVQ